MGREEKEAEAAAEPEPLVLALLPPLAAFLTPSQTCRQRAVFTLEC